MGRRIRRGLLPGDLPHDVDCAALAGCGDLDDALLDIVVFEAKGATDGCVQAVGANGVGEFEDGFVGEGSAEGGEGGVVDAAVLEYEFVGVGEDGALGGVEDVGGLPGGDGGELFFWDSGGAGGFAVLGVDELAGAEVAGADEGEFALEGGERPAAAGEEGEAVLSVDEDVGNEGEDGPPVAWGTGCGAGLGDGVAVSEEALVGSEGFGSGFGFGDLAETGHGEDL